MSKIVDKEVSFPFLFGRAVVVSSNYDGEHNNPSLHLSILRNGEEESNAGTDDVAVVRDMIRHMSEMIGDPVTFRSGL